MAGNYPLAFGELLAGAILLDKGVSAFKTALTSPGSATTTPTAATSASSLDTPAGGYTPQAWAAAILTLLDIRPTAQAIANVVAWETQEGGNWNNTARYNPLNTTENMPGATSINSDGVKAYSSWEQGLQATIDTLENGDYAAIIAALPGSAAEFQSTVTSSRWGTKF